MSKFCNNCGSAMEDDVVFCPNCGAQDAPAYDEAPAAKKPLNPMVLVLGGIAAVVVLVIVLLLIGSGPKRALKRYEKVVNGKGNIEKLYPEEFFKQKREDNEDFSKSEWLDKEEDSYKDSIKTREDNYGDNAKVTYTLLEKKNVTKDELEDIEDALDRQYDIDDKDVKQAVKMAVKAEVKGKEDKSFNYTQMIAVKIKGTWYLISYYEIDDKPAVSFY